jgi:co-chaperonin GroES (HSP10)
MSELNVTNKKILIKRNDKKTELDSGLVLPEDSVSKVNSGTVLKVGPEVSDIKVDNTVYFSYKNHELDIDGMNYVVLEEEDVLAYKDKE